MGNWSAPGVRWAIGLMRKQNVPVHIQRHCVKVAKVSLVLGMLLSKDFDLDLRLIRAGALVHDVCKMDAIRQGGDHALMGWELINRLGYPEVADIVRQHVFLKSPLNPRDKIDEIMIVNYADKRVMHTELVTLERRFDDIMKRYGRNESSIKRIKDLYKQGQILEQIIFSRLDIEPDELQI